LLDTQFANIFSQSVTCLLFISDSVFQRAKLLNSDEVQFVELFSLCGCLWYHV